MVQPRCSQEELFQPNSYLDCAWLWEDMSTLHTLNRRPSSLNRRPSSLRRHPVEALLQDRPTDVLHLRRPAKYCGSTTDRFKGSSCTYFVRQILPILSQKSDCIPGPIP